MTRQRTAAILVACALVLALGSYFLITSQPKDHSSLRQDVVPPEQTATPPAWVGQEQEAKPDYSSADAEPQTAKAAETTEDKKKAPAVIEVKEDKVITFVFVDSLVGYILDNFAIKDKYGRPATQASAKGLNVYFGQEMAGFKVKGNDVASARQTILNYAFTPIKIDLLYKLYAPLLVEQLVDSATNDEREYRVGSLREKRTLENAEISAMLRLNAVRISQTAAIFKAVASDPVLASMAGQYLQAAKSVDRANARLQTAIADEIKTTDEGKRLKQAIMQREQIKTEIVKKMQEICPGCEPKELFYLARWSYRRILGNEEKLASFDSASTILDDLAKRFQTKAAELDK